MFNGMRVREWQRDREEEKPSLTINPDPVKPSCVCWNQIELEIDSGAHHWNEQGTGLILPGPVCSLLNLASIATVFIEGEMTLGFALVVWSSWGRGTLNWGLGTLPEGEGRGFSKLSGPLVLSSFLSRKLVQHCGKHDAYDGLGARHWDRVRKWPVSMADFIH